MALRVYNTLTRQKEEFVPLTEGKVGMYLCGPTVYKASHIGHMVGPVIYDTMKRYLTYCGYDVTFVINVTDVDDKLINRANELGVPMVSLAESMTKDYMECLAAFGVSSVDHFPKATEHIGEMLAIIDKLVDDGHAYPLGGDVYFDTSSDDDYGKLSRRTTDAAKSGERIETTDQKRNPADFALWKGSKEGEPAWESKYGPGRPGWHIECSAMSMKLLGESFDIHGGGLDLMFPHHENELAQSECCTGKTFAKYWMHNGLMQADSASGKVGGGHDRHGDVQAETNSDSPDQSAQEANKMAGSAGAASVKTLFPKFPPGLLRFFLLSTHYRSPILFGDEPIREAAKSLEGFTRLFETAERIFDAPGKPFSFYSLPAGMTREASDEFLAGAGDLSETLAETKRRFVEAMDDDFNTAVAISALFDLRKKLNGFVTEKNLDSDAASEADKQTLLKGLTLLRELANVLGIFAEPAPASGGADDKFVGGLMDLVLQIRKNAREEKNWGIADQIRDALGNLSVVVEDRPDQTTGWSRSDG